MSSHGNCLSWSFFPLEVGMATGQVGLSFPITISKPEEFTRTGDVMDIIFSVLNQTVWHFTQIARTHERSNSINEQRKKNEKEYAETQKDQPTNYHKICYH